jgi:hypothetical protein
MIEPKSAENQLNRDEGADRANRSPSNETLRRQIESDPDDEPTAGAVYGFCKVCGSPLDWSREGGLHCIALADPEQPHFAEAVKKHLPLGDKT